MLHIENHDVKKSILEGNFGLEKESLRIKKTAHYPTLPIHLRMIRTL